MIDKNKDIVLFGASSFGEQAKKKLNKFGLTVSFFVDNDSKKWGKIIDGAVIKSPTELREIDVKQTLIIISSSFHEEIKEQLSQMGFKHNVHFFGGNGEWGEYPFEITLKGKPFAVNLADQRIINLLTKEFPSQKRLMEFWAKKVTEIKPDLVLDIGVNYGECILSSEYDFNCKVYGIEANPELIPYLERTIKIQNRKNVHIVNALAGNSERKTQDFYINTYSSGESKAFKTLDNHKRVVIPTIKVDDLLKNDSEKKVLLFKIDVEGFEYEVIKGMKNILSQVKKATGYIEFDKRLLELNKVNAEDFLRYLAETFWISIFDMNNEIVREMKRIREILLEKNFHTDIILELKS